MAIPGTDQPQTRDVIDLIRGSDAGMASLRDSKAMRVPRFSYPFLLRHHESNWFPETEGLEAPTFLPEIVPHIIMVGAAGIRTINATETFADSFKGARADAIDRGWHYIPADLDVTDPKHLPAGVAPGGWMRTVQAVHMRTSQSIPWYFTPWDVPIQTPRDQVQRWRFDRASFNRWRLHLVQTSVIPEPMESVLEELRARYGNHVTRAQGSNNPDREHKAAKVEAAKAVADTLTKAAIPTEVEQPKPAKPGRKERP
jgi:hypothetical protein